MSQEKRYSQGKKFQNRVWSFIEAEMKDMTQEKFAEKVGWRQRSYLSHFKNGKVIPSDKLLKQMAIATKMPDAEIAKMLRAAAQDRIDFKQDKADFEAWDRSRNISPSAGNEAEIKTVSHDISFEEKEILPPVAEVETATSEAERLMAYIQFFEKQKTPKELMYDLLGLILAYYKPNKGEKPGTANLNLISNRREADEPKIKGGAK